MENNIKKLLKFTIMGLLFFVIVLTTNELYAASPKQLQKCNIALPKSSYEYTGKAIQPVPKVKYNTKTLTKNTDYTVSYRNNINAGIALVIIRGQGNFTGQKIVTFKINKRDIQTADVSLTKSTFTYDGSAKKPQIKSIKIINDAGNIIPLNRNNFTVSYRNNINAGIALVIIRGQGNFTGQKIVTFKINKRNIQTADVSLTKSTFTYDGSAKKPQIKSIKIINDAGKIISLHRNNFTVRYTNNINAGTASVVIRGNNFIGSKTINFTIKKGLITDCSITVDDGYNIEGIPAEPEVNIRINDIRLNDENYSLEYYNNTTVGTGLVIITGQKNLRGSVEMNFNIIPIAELKNQTGEGYNQIVTVGNKTYKIYNQRAFSRLISRSGCSITSEAIVLSAFGKDLTPKDIADDVAWIFPRTIEQIAGDLNRYGIICSYESLKGNEIQEAQNDSVIENTERIIKNNLLKGNPVIMLVHQGKDNRYTSDAHYIVLVGMDKNGNPAIADPNGVGYRCETDLRTLIKEYMYFNSRLGERGYVLIQTPTVYQYNKVVNKK